MTKQNVQQAKASALPVNQSGQQIQCFECQQWEHKKADYPNKANKTKISRPLLPPQKEAFHNQNKNPNKGKILE